MKLFTIGHSNRTLDEFVELLHYYKIQCLIDVRTIPQSRHVPWFNKENLSKSLEKENITYMHLPDLGGLRHTHANSSNMAWENTSFRGFADYMQTKAFFTGLKKLNQRVKQYTFTAIMCAEALPWRCHRSLIADAEVVRNFHVIHILQKKSIKNHELTDFSVVNRHKRPIQITYPKIKFAQ